MNTPPYLSETDTLELVGDFRQAHYDVQAAKAREKEALEKLHVQARKLLWELATFGTLVNELPGIGIPHFTNFNIHVLHPALSTGELEFYLDAQAGTGAFYFEAVNVGEQGDMIIIFPISMLYRRDWYYKLCMSSAIAHSKK